MTIRLAAAYMLGNTISRDIYTVLMDAKNLPYLPSFRFPKSKLAKDIMVPDPPALVCAAKPAYSRYLYTAEGRHVNHRVVLIACQRMGGVPGQLNETLPPATQ